MLEVTFRIVGHNARPFASSILRLVGDMSRLVGLRVRMCLYFWLADDDSPIMLRQSMLLMPKACRVAVNVAHYMPASSQSQPSYLTLSY